MKTSRLLAATLILGAGATGLSGCSELVLPTPVAAEAHTHPALDAEHVEAINAAIFDTLKEADGKLDTDLMKTRLTGPAADARSLEYKKKSILGDGNSLTPVSSGAMQSAVTQSDVYPRLLVQIMEAPEGKNLQTLDLTIQTAPRNNWALWGALEIHSGATVPSIATGETGATPVAADDAGGLVASPNAVVDAYIKLNQTGDDANGLAFAEDKIRSSIAKQVENYRTRFDGKANVAIEFARGATGPYAVRTADGGALVFAELNYTTKIELTEEGAVATIPENNDVALILSGKADESPKFQETFTAHYTYPVAIVVPPAEAEDATIRAIASASPTIFGAEVTGAPETEEGNVDE